MRAISRRCYAETLQFPKTNFAESHKHQIACSTMVDNTAYEKARIGDAAYFETAELSNIKNFKDGNGSSVLSVAAAVGHLNCCQVIYRRCPQLLDERNINRDSALHEAANNGQGDIVKFLIYAAQGGVVDSHLLIGVNDSKSTALHGAAKNGHFESVKWLIEADHNKLLGMVNGENETAIDLAEKNNHAKIVRLLCQAENSGSTRSGHAPQYIAVLVAVPLIFPDAYMKVRSTFSFLGLCLLPDIISRCVSHVGILLRVGFIKKCDWEDWSGALSEEMR